MDHKALLKDLREQVSLLEEDLRERTDSEPEFYDALNAEYGRARAAHRTAAAYGTWRDDRVTQVAVAWVLAAVFVRFCEDNNLIRAPWLAGPGERLAEADERHQAFFKEHPEKNDRDWLVAAFDHLASTNETVAGLFDRDHNPLWELSPSYEAASAFLRFWRRTTPEGEIAHNFTDSDLNTRFLGDLYQDLSDHAKKTFALLQTPEFVEEFILDLTLEPAIEEFGLEPAWIYKPNGWSGDESIVRGLRTIDPACGSGHFLLGIFRRVLAKWEEKTPGADRWTQIRRALESVHGCDKNPFAAKIARFRLLVAALQAAKETRLDRAPTFPINVAVGDSLLHGRGAVGVQIEAEDALLGSDQFAYRAEDVGDFIKRRDLLGKNSYHAVVANPPYITAKDKQENRNYRAYSTVSGQCALSVPFTQRVFELAIRGNDKDLHGAGFTGLITANSFMKREFGKKLVTWLDATVDLSHVIDTSGAYIPGHGTPTVILAGCNRVAREDSKICVVLGVQGEPAQPDDPSKGLVWSAIVDQVRTPGAYSAWVSAIKSGRKPLSSHPWSLAGGGAADLMSLIERGFSRLGTQVRSIGRTTATGADDVFFLPDRAAAARRGDADSVRALIVGDAVRDFRFASTVSVRNPYSDRKNRYLLSSDSHLVARSLWPWRCLLSSRMIFGRTILDAGHAWYAHLENYTSKLETRWGIVFAFVASHNHFVLDTEGRLSNRTAPVIKFPEEFGEEAYLTILGVLNSSTACFWLKQVSQDKGNRGGERGTGRYAWESFYEFTGTRLKEFPLPASSPLELGRVLDKLARELQKYDPAVISVDGVPDRESLGSARIRHNEIRTRMIALQEELDWKTYASYELISSELLAQTAIENLDEVPAIVLGERAFEIYLASHSAGDEAVSQWFIRHGSSPVVEIPGRWPEEYRRVVQARIDLIESRPRDIGLLERPEYKRRWADEPWEKKEKAALRGWILDRCEQAELWFGLRDGLRHPRTMTVSQLADQFRSDEDIQSVAALYAADHLGKRDLPLVDVLAEVVADEHVPFLASLRYGDTGLRKRVEWERVWERQREEDLTGKRLDIAVPPKYAPKDFKKNSYWSQRGKLDVPKERFISYPGGSPDADETLLLGWAGWDHKDQAQALVNLVNDRTVQGAWGVEKLTPLFAGLLEVMPWVHQWHGEYDAEWEGVPAEEFQAFLDEQRGRYQLSEQNLRDWRPAAKGRKKKA